MSEPQATSPSNAAPVESPPPAAIPVQNPAGADPRQTLHRLASELMRAHNRRLLIEFLQLRRILR
jgi:hypothetical protein